MHVEPPNLASSSTDRASSFTMVEGISGMAVSMQPLHGYGDECRAPPWILQQRSVKPMDPLDPARARVIAGIRWGALPPPRWSSLPREPADPLSSQPLLHAQQASAAGHRHRRPLISCHLRFLSTPLVGMRERICERGERASGM